MGREKEREMERDGESETFDLHIYNFIGSTRTPVKPYFLFTAAKYEIRQAVIKKNI